MVQCRGLRAVGEGDCTGGGGGKRWAGKVGGVGGGVGRGLGGKGGGKGWAGKGGGLGEGKI